MRGHIDAETLAEFREGLLPRRRAQQVTAHLAECLDCTGLDAQLAGLPAVLASTPAPPIPAALTTRIEAALAAEAAARAAQVTGAEAGTTEAPSTFANGATPGTATPGTAAPGTATPGTATPGDTPALDIPTSPVPAPRTRTPQPRRPAPRAPAGRPGPRTRTPGRSRVLLGFAAAAAAVVVIGGGGYGLSQLFSNNGSAQSASSGAGTGALGAPRSPAQGAGASGHSAAKSPESAPATGSLPSVTHSGTDYRPAELRHQVTVAMTKFGPALPGSLQPTPVRSSRSGTPVRISPSTTLPTLPPCVTRLLAGQRPLFVDSARYQGRPAVVFVVPGNGSTLRVLVAAADCSGRAGHLLASTTLPR